MKLWLVIFGLIQLFLFFLSFQRIRNSRGKFGFIYPWAFLFGAFVWEDLFIFSFFLLLTTIYTLIIADIRYFLLIISVFWTVRSGGEVLYFFMQQINQPDHAPHNIHWHFGAMKKILSNISAQKCFILMQIIFQVIMVCSISFLILLLKNWTQIASGF